MNWDTNETWNWISEYEIYKSILEKLIGNELLFCAALVEMIVAINSKLPEPRQIEMKNVNGNELYIDFCELFGNEQRGWCGNES